MRALVQRVSRAAVSVDGATVGSIDRGLLVLLGVGRDDGPDDVAFLARKVAQLRIFADGAGRMGVSCADAGGAVLVVSQFTLYGDCRKGNRPGFDRAAPPELARSLYESFVEAVASYGLEVATGQFRAMMDVESVNDGPVTLWLESEPARRG